jgi:hypothetical protein
MNPLQIESAIRTALSASALPTTTIYLGNDYQELTPESLNLIVACDRVEKVSANLYRATTTIHINSPGLLGASSLSEMTAMINTLRVNLTSAYFTTYWTGTTPAFAGMWVNEIKTQRDQHDWIAMIECIFGVTI